MSNELQPDLLTPAAAPEPRLSLIEMLRRKYPSPEWAFMEEVAPRTGGGTRYADAVAVGLWASRGHAVHGFELKASRSDWLRELKQPEKAEPIFRFCDFWVVVTEKGVVKDGELPPTWGLLERRGNGLVISKAPPKLQAQPVSREFFASLMRRGHEQIEAIAARTYIEKLNQAHQDTAKRIAEAVAHATREHKEFKARVEKFTAETGIVFERYSGPSTATIKLAQRLQGLEGWRGNGALAKLKELADSLDLCAGHVREALKKTELEGPPE